MFKNFHLSKPTIFNLVLVAVVVYCFLAALPATQGIQVGLDPSWMFAISQVRDQNLLFGKDIIFTYGPLGYLIEGAAITSNIEKIVVFRLSVYFLFLGLVIARLLTLQKYFTKLIWGSAIAFLLFLSPMFDYQILYIFLIVLSFDKIVLGSLRSIAIAFGILAGFAMLSKLTLGIYIAGTFYLFLLGNAIQSYWIAGDKKFDIYFRYLQSFCHFTLASLSIATIFLFPPTLGVFATKLSVNLAIAAGSYLAIDLVLKNSKIGRASERWIPASVAYLLYSLLFLQTLSRKDLPSIIDYIGNLWQISSGYSSAMSLIGPFGGLAMAFFSLISLIPLLYFLLKSQHIGLAISFLFPIFLAFKHGFVRQDGHVLIFAITMIFTAGLCLLKLEDRPVKVQKLSYVLYALILLSCASITYGNIGYTSRIGQFGPSDVIRNVNRVSLLLNWNQFTERSRQSTRANISALNQSVKLPETVLEKVRGKTIDIIPWEFSIVPANGLNWQPRPSLQSYAAYTEKLDEMNYQSLSRSPRDFLFYQFQAIDGRHPFFDEPKAFSYVFCNYKPESIDRLFTTESLKLPYILLDKQNASRCAADGTGETTSIAWDTVYELPTRENAITRARIEFQYSLLGKMIKTLFRIPPVFIEVNYLDGGSARFRIIPDNSANGPIVSHLPRNEEEITFFLQGKLPPQIKSFRFSVSNPGLFAPEIRVTPFWETYR